MLRESADLSLQIVARRIAQMPGAHEGFAASTLKRIEDGVTSDPGIYTCERIARALGRELWTLLAPEHAPLALSYWNDELDDRERERYRRSLRAKQGPDGARLAGLKGPGDPEPARANPSQILTQEYRDRLVATMTVVAKAREGLKGRARVHMDVRPADPVDAARALLQLARSASEDAIARIVTHVLADYDESERGAVVDALEAEVRGAA